MLNVPCLTHGFFEKREDGVLVRNEGVDIDVFVARGEGRVGEDGCDGGTDGGQGGERYGVAAIVVDGSCMVGDGVT